MHQPAYIWILAITVSSLFPWSLCSFHVGSYLFERSPDEAVHPHDAGPSSTPQHHGTRLHRRMLPPLPPEGHPDREDTINYWKWVKQQTNKDFEDASARFRVATLENVDAPGYHMRYQNARQAWDRALEKAHHVDVEHLTHVQMRPALRALSLLPTAGWRPPDQESAPPHRDTAATQTLHKSILRESLVALQEEYRRRREGMHRRTSVGQMQHAKEPSISTQVPGRSPNTPQKQMQGEKQIERARHEAAQIDMNIRKEWNLTEKSPEGRALLHKSGSASEKGLSSGATVHVQGQTLRSTPDTLELRRGSDSLPKKLHFQEQEIDLHQGAPSTSVRQDRPKRSRRPSTKVIEGQSLSTLPSSSDVRAPKVMKTMALNEERPKAQNAEHHLSSGEHRASQQSLKLLPPVGQPSGPPSLRTSTPGALQSPPGPRLSMPMVPLTPEQFLQLKGFARPNWAPVRASPFDQGQQTIPENSVYGIGKQMPPRHPAWQQGLSLPVAGHYGTAQAPPQVGALTRTAQQALPKTEVSGIGNIMPSQHPAWYQGLPLPVAGRQGTAQAPPQIGLFPSAVRPPPPPPNPFGMGGVLPQQHPSWQHVFLPGAAGRPNAAQGPPSGQPSIGPSLAASSLSFGPWTLDESGRIRSWTQLQGGSPRNQRPDPQGTQGL